MVADVTYQMVIDVTDSWSNLKYSVPNSETTAGELIYMKLLELEPKVADVLKLDTSSASFRDDPRFTALARNMFDMIDCTVAFLGPDLDPLAEELLRLGRRHIRYGVQPHHLMAMGDAILFAMRELLGSRFSDDEANAWKIVYGFMVTHMIKGLQQ